VGFSSSVLYWRSQNWYIFVRTHTLVPLVDAKPRCHKKEQHFPYPEFSYESVCFSWSSTVHYTNTFGNAHTFVKHSPVLAFNFLRRLLFAPSSWSSLFLGGFCVFGHQFLPALTNEIIILIHQYDWSLTLILNSESHSLSKKAKFELRSQRSFFPLIKFFVSIIFYTYTLIY